MSGRKHHHVPQFLQRRFGQTGRKSTKVFVYKKDGRVFPTSTENYGAERDFYAEGDDFFVDDLITDYEEDIQPFLGRLNEGESPHLAIVELSRKSYLILKCDLRFSGRK